MYEELIKRLRECTSEQNGEKTLWHQAADAIEELQKQSNDAWNSGYKCGVDDAAQVDLVKKMSYWWIPVTEQLPEDGKRCLVICRGRIDICWFAKDLYKVDKYDFHDKKKKSGFYQYDSEWGHFERTGITHWMPLPQPPESEDE